VSLTILMPVKHHHPVFLRKAVASVVAQSSPHWTLLVLVEPEDATRFADMLRHEMQDARIRVVTNQGRRMAGALNTGMRAATSEFVAILLADDLWADDAVAVLLRAIASHPEVDFFHSARRYVDAEDRFCSSIHMPRASFTLADFARGSPVKHLLCWRRAMAVNIGGLDESMTIGPDDYDFPWSMAEHGAVFRALPECLYLYRDHRESYRLTTHVPRSVQKRCIRQILRKHGVSRAATRAHLANARRSFLRQCLFRSRFHQWLKVTWGYDARHGQREQYS
jgi:glycosyltransferase involved in cell wall biosynthesis